MRYLSVVFLAVLFVSAAAGDWSGWGPSETIESTGGPDAYGYTWIDSDEATGPTYNWIDISMVGTEVTDGLHDDNAVGPYFFGFDFPYYWYTVNMVGIGSNGYLCFDGPANISATFPSCPSTAAPNNLLHVNTDDWNFDGDTLGTYNSHCYFYTNSVDSVVVTWDSLPHWNQPSSMASFQVILSAADSSVVFQYAIWTSVGITSDAPVIGIEDITGTIGLQYWKSYSPGSNNPTPGTAVLFHPEPDPMFTITDLAVNDVQNEGSKGFLTVAGDPVHFYAYVKNAGTETIASYDTRILLTRVVGGIAYGDTVTAGPIASGEVDTLDFGVWAGEGTPYEYRVNIQGLSWGDAIPANDSKMGEMRALAMSETTPVWFEFVTGGLDSGQTWQGMGSGYGMRYVSPVYPIMVTRIESFNFNNTGAVQGDVLLYDDDGPDGLPGTVLYQTAIWADTGAWRGGDCNVWIPGGAFYVGFLQNYSPDGPATAFQSTTPISRNALEYTGSWAPSRDMDIHDIGLRANVRISPAGAPEEPVANVPDSYDLFQNLPNPFNPVTVINYSLPVASSVRLDVYNVLGQRVTTLVDEEQNAGYHMVTWDASNVSSGVYFYRLQAGEFAKTRKMTVLK